MRIVAREGIHAWWSAPLGRLGPLRQELAAFFGWNYLTVTFAGLLIQGPLLLLGWMRGPEAAAYYRLATSIVATGSFLDKSLGQVTYPIMSARWAKGERGSLKASLERWTLQGGVPVGLLLLLSVPLMPVLVPWIFGETYRPMVLGLQLMMAGAAVDAAFFTMKPFYYASGQAGRFAKAHGIYTVIVLALSWLVIEQWGFPGMAGLIATGKVAFTVTLVALALVSLGGNVGRVPGETSAGE